MQIIDGTGESGPLVQRDFLAGARMRANRSSESVSPRCRHCRSELTLRLVNLGVSPVANDFVDLENYMKAEPCYPLEAMVCRECRLVQTRDVLVAEDVFRADYAYFSSHSSSWLEHANSYVEKMVARFGLNSNSRHVEVASNDGYLLQYSVAKGIPCLGVEPCESVALAGRKRGIDTRIEFFGEPYAKKLVAEGWKADLITANNVLAHVPNINDFVAGIRVLLNQDGVATFEVQHLLKLMMRHQFDTIYHEHFSYLSLMAGLRIFNAAGLRVFDVELLETHGGSIRFFVCHRNSTHPDSPRVAQVLAEESAYGLDTDAAYTAWNESVKATKRDLLELLMDLKRRNKKIAG